MMVSELRKNATSNNPSSPVAVVGRNIDSVIEEEEKEISEQKEPKTIKITVDKKEQFVADQSRQAKYYIHDHKGRTEKTNPQEIRCRTFNVPKDFRNQFRKQDDQEESKVKLVTKESLKNSLIPEEQENEGNGTIAMTTSQKTGEYADQMERGSSKRLNRFEQIQL